MVLSQVLSGIVHPSEQDMEEMFGGERLIDGQSGSSKMKPAESSFKDRGITFLEIGKRLARLGNVVGHPEERKRFWITLSGD